MATVTESYRYLIKHVIKIVFFAAKGLIQWVREPAPDEGAAPDETQSGSTLNQD
jgi:hypothetical protein